MKDLKKIEKKLFNEFLDKDITVRMERSYRNKFCYTQLENPIK